jgi:hypothetical protein
MSDKEIVIINQNLAPMERISLDQLITVSEQVKVRIRNAAQMTEAEVRTIAQEAILYRIVPGQDVHYFVNEREEKDSRGQIINVTRTLERVFDYKFLMNLAHWLESRRTGLPNPQLEPIFPPMDDKARAREGLHQNDMGAYCTLVSQADRKLHRQEIAEYIKMGLKPEIAVETVERLYGRPGTTAIGVVRGNDYKIPSGWSKLAKAQKLALKNAIMRRYGLPTADEMMYLARERASIARPDDWNEVDPFLPIEAQARQADTIALTREIVEENRNLTPEQQQAKKKNNVNLMRGEDEGGIGESDREEFVRDVLRDIPFYTSESQIFMTLLNTGLEFNQEIRDLCFDELEQAANLETDKISA